MLNTLEKPITSLSQLDITKQYSYADYLQWQIEERLELIRGFIARMSPAPNRYHQKISSQFHALLGSYFLQKSCHLYAAPFDVRLVLPASIQLSKKTKVERVSDASIMTVVQPDLCVICDLEKLDDRGCLGAPDLVIEILSPGNTKREMKDKYSVYEESGVKEYWIVQPAYKNVLTYRLEGEQYRYVGAYTEEEALRTPLFEGLQVPLNIVFKD